MVPQSAKFPISWWHHEPISPCQGSIVCLYHPLCVPLVVPKVVHRLGYPLCAKGGYPKIVARVKLPI